MQSLGKESQLPGPGRNVYRICINTLGLGSTNPLFCAHQLLTRMVCGGSWPLQELTTNHPTGRGAVSQQGLVPLALNDSLHGPQMLRLLWQVQGLFFFFNAFGAHTVLLCWGKASTNSHVRPVYVGNRTTANRHESGFMVLFWDRVSLCSFDWTGACYVDQADLELKNCLPVSWVLGIKSHAPMPGQKRSSIFYICNIKWHHIISSSKKALGIIWIS